MRARLALALATILALLSGAIASCDAEGDGGPVVCAAGTQDHDGDGICLAACSPDVCGPGACDDADGTLRCDCETAYTGPRCQQCSVGYLRFGGADKACTPSCALTACVHGECLDCGATIGCSGEDGPTCVCEAWYAGAACDECAPGFVDDGKGACVFPPCDENPCGPGECTQTETGKVCTCPPAYAGAYCEVCNVGYHADGDVCVPD